MRYWQLEWQPGLERCKLGAGQGVGYTTRHPDKLLCLLVEMEQARHTVVWGQRLAQNLLEMTMWIE